MKETAPLCRPCGGKRCRTVLWVGTLLMLAVGNGGRESALAQAPGMRVRFADIRQQAAELLLHVNRSLLLQFDETLQRVAVSEPKIAEAVIVTPTQVLLNAKSIGRCTLVVWSSVDPDRARVSSKWPSEQIWTR